MSQAGRRWHTLVHARIWAGRVRRLRTVFLEDVRTSLVLLPAGRLAIVSGKILHGAACRHETFWAPELGLDPDDETFAIPAEQVVATRPMAIGARIIKHKRS